MSSQCMTQASCQQSADGTHYLNWCVGGHDIAESYNVPEYDSQQPVHFPSCDLCAEEVNRSECQHG